MAKYAKAAGGNWSASATWSATSSAGADSAGAPTATDDVIFDAGANNIVTVDTTTCVAKTLTCQNAANKITFTSGQKLTVSGNVTFVASMTLAGTGNLTINAAATITSGGVTFPGSLTFSINGTVTLGDSWTVTGLVNTTVNTTTLNTNTLNCVGGFAATGAVAGSSVFNISGGTWSGDVSHGVPVRISGNMTMSGRVRLVGNSSLTYSSGAVTLSNSILYLAGSTVPINCTVALGDLQPISGTLNMVSALTVNKVIWGGTVGMANYTVIGSNSMTCSTLNFMGGSVTASATGGNIVFTYPSTRNLTVLTALNLSNDGIGASLMTLKSSTASSAMNLIYAGTGTNCFVSGMTFTDVDASGSTQVINNLNGGTLTRTTNITNRSVSSFLDLFGGLS